MAEISLDKIELQAIIDQSNKILAKEEQFRRLVTSQDFKDVFIEGLCKNDCSAYNVIVNAPNARQEQVNAANKFLVLAGLLPHWLDAKEASFIRAKDDKQKAQEDLDNLASQGE